MKSGSRHRGENRNSWGTISVVLCLLVLPYFAEAQSGAKIKDIHFIGNETFSDGHLRDIMHSESSTGFSQILAEEDEYLYDEELIADGIARLGRFYAREGFIRVAVGTAKVAEFDRKKDEIVLSIAVFEGPSVKVDNVWYDITGASGGERDMLSDVFAELEETMALKPAERFRDSLLFRDRDSLHVALSNHGYPFADVNYDLQVDTANYVVDVAWRIATGPLVTFDTISIVGNTRIGDDDVRDMVAFEPGQRYDRRLVNRTQQQIYGLGMFQVATVHPQLADGTRSEVPVVISLREGPRYRVKFGIGYGREEKLRSFVDLRKYGFLGGARTLRLFLKRSDLEPYNVRFTATQPAFLHPRTTLSISPYVWRQEEKAFDVRRIGGDIQVSHTFSEDLSGAVTYTYENVRVYGSAPAPDIILKGMTIDRYKKSSISLGAQFDNSEPLFSPARGVFTANNLTFSGLGFGSDFHFWKDIAEVRHYYTIKRVTLAGRLKIGGAREFSDEDIIPLEERLFSGGSNSVRGWQRQELGPMVDDIPVGGRSLLEGSFEVRYPVFGMFSGAIFLDFGNVWLDSFSYPIDDLRYAAGLGVRVSTPIGPIRVDVARPIFDEEKTLQLHVSVGQAF